MNDKPQIIVVPLSGPSLDVVVAAVRKMPFEVAVPVLDEINAAVTQHNMMAAQAAQAKE